MRFIFIFILLSITFVSSGQNVPWVPKPTSISHVVNISNANITVDNTPIETGDAVGLFYDSLGSLACSGFAIWPATQIIAYGDDSGEPNGFSINEPFKFKIWKKQNDCIIDSGTIVQFEFIPFVFKDSIYFKANGTSKMITMNGAKKEISYSKNNYCTGDANPLPIKKGKIADVTYSSQTGLVINPTTGLIDIAASQRGTYTIYFNTSLCLIAESFVVKIKLNIDDLGITITKSTCTTPGQILIDPSTIQCGATPIEYKLRNIISGEETISTSNSIANVPDASYELYVKDVNGDEAKLSYPIVVSKDCKDLILAPNTTGEASSYFIPHQGIAKIYDRFGLLRKEITTPGDWDGTDNSGNQVPMGQYVIICDKDKQIVVTVIK